MKRTQITAKWFTVVLKNKNKSQTEFVLCWHNSNRKLKLKISNHQDRLTESRNELQCNFAEFARTRSKSTTERVMSGRKKSENKRWSREGEFTFWKREKQKRIRWISVAFYNIQNIFLLWFLPWKCFWMNFPSLARQNNRLTIHIVIGNEKKLHKSRNGSWYKT